MEDIKIFTSYQKRSFRGALTNGKLNGICAFSAMGNIWKKLIFIHWHFCLGKYSFSLDTFWTHLNNGNIFKRNTFSLAVLILFEREFLVKHWILQEQQSPYSPRATVSLLTKSSSHPTVTRNWLKIPKRDFIFAHVKTGQVGTWSPIE